MSKLQSTVHEKEQPKQAHEGGMRTATDVPVWHLFREFQVQPRS